MACTILGNRVVLAVGHAGKIADLAFPERAVWTRQESVLSTQILVKFLQTMGRFIDQESIPALAPP